VVQFYAPRYESGSRTAKLMRIPETQFRHPSIISVRYRSIPVPDSITVFRVRTYSGIGISLYSGTGLKGWLAVPHSKKLQVYEYRYFIQQLNRVDPSAVRYILAQ